MSLKKRLCNPPVEMVAAAGDHELHGLFVGAGAAADLLREDQTHAAVVRHYVNEVTEVEAYYLTERKKLAKECTERMRRLESSLLQKVGESY